MFRLRKSINISDIAEQSLIYENIDSTSTYAFDIHTVLADKMYEFLFDLSRTMGILTVIMNIFVEDFFSTGRTNTWHRNLASIMRSTIRDSTDDIRNHFSAPLQSHSIVKMDIFGGDEIVIMQTDSLDSNTTKLYRFKICNRRNNARTTHLKINRIDLSSNHLRREFVGYCPSRMMIRRTYKLA